MQPTSQSILEHFLHTSKKPHTHQSLPPSATLIYVLSLQICLLWALHINGITHYVAFCVWLLTLSLICPRFIHTEFHLMISTSFFFLYAWFIFHSMDVTTFVHPLSSWWTSELFQHYGCYIKCCYEHMSVYFHFISYPQEYHCKVIW